MLYPVSGLVGVRGYVGGYVGGYVVTTYLNVRGDR